MKKEKERRERGEHAAHVTSTTRSGEHFLTSPLNSFARVTVTLFAKKRKEKEGKEEEVGSTFREADVRRLTSLTRRLY